MGKPKPSQKKVQSAKPRSKTQSSKNPTSSSVSIPESAPSSQSTTLPFPLLQQILSTFRTALLPTILSSTSNTTTITTTASSSAPSTSGRDLRSIIQEVKSHLYNRDFAAAFGREDYLHAYALRWSASRALGYATIFAGDEIRGLFSVDGKEGDEVGVDHDVGTTTTTRKKIVCIGGGAAAEVVALNALHRCLDKSDLEFEVHAVDIADWSGVLEKLESAWKVLSSRSLYSLTPAPSSSSPPTTSQAAGPTASSSASASLTDTTTIESSTSTATTLNPSTPSLSTLSLNDSYPPPYSPITLKFHHLNILTTPLHTLTTLLSSSPSSPPIITLFFTLNELFTTSIPLTTKFLLTLTDLVPPGTVLLVIDSPGSYSDVSLGNSGSGSTKKTTTNTTETEQASPSTTTTTKRKYPLKFLLEHTLLEITKQQDSHHPHPPPAAWQKVLGHDSRWFRLPSSPSSKGGGGGGAGEGEKEKLRYIMDLENMRYQIYMFRRV